MKRVFPLVLAVFALTILGWGGEIHDAVAKGNVARVQALLAKDKLLVEARDHPLRQTPLQVAASAGQLEVAKVLLAAGADIDAGDKDPPITLALLPPELLEKVASFNRALAEGRGEFSQTMEIWAGFRKVLAKEDPALPKRRLTMVRLLFESGAKVKWEGVTLLHLAAVLGDAELVGFIAGKAPSVNARDRDMRTPLAYAAMAGNMEAAKTLLDREGRVGAVDRLGLTPLFFAVAAGHLPMVELLLARQAPVDAQSYDGRTALHAAVAKKDIALVRCLLKAGADREVPAKSGATPLHAACSGGAKEVVEVLLEGSVKIDVRDTEGFTPALNALEKGNGEIFELLVAKGADPKVRIGDGRSALHLLCSTPAKPESIERLLALGLDLETRDGYGFTPLQVGARCGYVPVVETLLRRGANLEAASGNGNTALLLATDLGREMPKWIIPYGTPADYRKICDILVAKGARLDVKSKNGRTVLHGAAGSDNLALLELCVAKGIEINAVSEDGLTPLHEAAAMGRAATAAALLRLGARVEAVDRDGQTPLHYAAYQNADPEIFATLKKHGAGLEARTVHRVTPLGRAAAFGNLAGVRALLQLGANPRAGDEYENTPLHEAANIGDRRRVRRSEMRTPEAEQQAMRAASLEALQTDLPARHLEIVRALLDAGAAPNAKNSAGVSPLSVGQQFGTPEICQRLEEAAKAPPKPSDRRR